MHVRTLAFASQVMELILDKNFFLTDLITVILLLSLSLHFPFLSFLSFVMQKYNSNSAWWNFAVVGNYAARFYSFSMAPEGLVRTLQRNVERRLEKGVVEVEKKVVALFSHSSKIKGEADGILVRDRSAVRGVGAGTSMAMDALEDPSAAMEVAVALLTAFSCTEGDAVSAQWRDLLPRVLTTYRDGMVIGDTHKAVFTIQKMFYPRWWLETVGYFNNGGNPHGILFSSNPEYSNRWSYSDVCLLAVAALLCVLTGFVLGKRSAGITSQSPSFLSTFKSKKGYVTLASRKQVPAAPSTPQATLESYQH